MPVTVQEAIRKGQLTVNLPSGGFILAGVVAAFILDKENTFPTWVIIVTACAGFLSATVYWSIATTKWKIWAYENVDHIQSLKIRPAKQG